MFSRLSSLFHGLMHRLKLMVYIRHKCVLERLPSYLLQFFFLYIRTIITKQMIHGHQLLCEMALPLPILRALITAGILEICQRKKVPRKTKNASQC